MPEEQSSSLPLSITTGSEGGDGCGPPASIQVCMVVRQSAALSSSYQPNRARAAFDFGLHVGTCRRPFSKDSTMHWPASIFPCRLTSAKGFMQNGKDRFSLLGGPSERLGAVSITVHYRVSPVRPAPDSGYCQREARRRPKTLRLRSGRHHTGRLLYGCAISQRGCIRLSPSIAAPALACGGGYSKSTMLAFDRFGTRAEYGG